MNAYFYRTIGIYLMKRSITISVTRSSVVYVVYAAFTCHGNLGTRVFPSVCVSKNKQQHEGTITI